MTEEEAIPPLAILNIVSNIVLDKEDIEKLPYWAYLYVEDKEVSYIAIINNWF